MKWISEDYSKLYKDKTHFINNVEHLITKNTNNNYKDKL